jgi:hypothetical protein
MFRLSHFGQRRRDARRLEGKSRLLVQMSIAIHKISGSGMGPKQGPRPRIPAGPQVAVPRGDFGIDGYHNTATSEAV